MLGVVVCRLGVGVGWRASVRCGEVADAGADPGVQDEFAERDRRARRVGLEGQRGGRGEDDVEQVVWVRCYADEEEEVRVLGDDLQQRRGGGRRREAGVRAVDEGVTYDLVTASRRSVRETTKTTTAPTSDAM